MRTKQRANHCHGTFILECLQIPSCSERNAKLDFFVYPFSLRLYDTDVDCLEFINDSDRTVSVSCFGQQIVLAPGESRKLNNNGNRYRHSAEE